LLQQIVADSAFVGVRCNDPSIPLTEQGSRLLARDGPLACISSGIMSEVLSSITGFYTWKYSSLLVKEYQYIRILFELSTKLLSNR
jgi:hypothetical protein